MQSNLNCKTVRSIYPKHLHQLKGLRLINNAFFSVDFLLSMLSDTSDGHVFFLSHPNWDNILIQRLCVCFTHISSQISFVFLHVIIHKLNFKSHSLKRVDANARKMFKILLINGCASIIFLMSALIIAVLLLSM